MDSRSPLGQTQQDTDGPDWSFLQNASYQDKIEGHWGQIVWKAFGSFIPIGARLLEVGCGSGKIAVQSGRLLEARVFGIDVSPQAIEYARGLAAYQGVSAGFAVASGFALPFVDGSFDVVLSEGVIEHFSRQDTGRMVAEHARVCRIGGRVLIAVPNLLNLPLTYHKVRTGRRYHAYPERSYTVWGLARLMSEHGLLPVAFSGFAPAVGLEWFIHPRLSGRWLDRWTPHWFGALFGYEVLVVAEKAG